MSARGIAINGAAVREIRKRLGIRAEDLADEVGISREYVVSIETGRRIAVSQTVYKDICIALRIDDVRAIAGHPNETAIANAIAELVENAPPLSESQRQHLALLLPAGE